MAKRKAGDVEVGTHVQIHGDRKVGGDGVPKLLQSTSDANSSAVVRFHLAGRKYVDAYITQGNNLRIRGSESLAVCPVVSNALTIGVKQP